MKILVVEDQTMVRGLVSRVCRDTFPAAEIVEAGNGADALAVCGQLQPDLLLLDLELPDIDGLDLLDELRRHAAAVLRVLVLSSHTEPFALSRLRSAEIHGFVDKNEQTPETLCAALREVVAGHRYFSATVDRGHAALRADPRAFDKLLSDREQELLRLFGQGLSNDEVAARHGLTPVTARNHRRNIMGKLGIHSTPELIQYAIENGFARIRRRG
ncbi:MAG: response regulator transcription factor [Opitutaceae bacterium]